MDHLCVGMKLTRMFNRAAWSPGRGKYLNDRYGHSVQRLEGFRSGHLYNSSKQSEELTRKPDSMMCPWPGHYLYNKHTYLVKQDTSA